MSYRLIALDLDGTLKNSHNEITRRTKETLFACQEKGICVVLASGRPMAGLRNEAALLELKRFGGVLLAFNGAKVYDLKAEKIVYEKTVSTETAYTIYDRAKAFGLGVLTYDEEDRIISEDVEDEYVQIESRINGLELHKVFSWKTALAHDVNKVLLTGKPEYLEKIEAEFKAPFGDDLSIYRSSPFFIEVMAQGIDKANSLNHLCEYLHISREETMAFGDGFNDISMIEFAGLGVAMDNAQYPVKQAANLITGSNDEDGIADVLEEYILRGE